MVHMYRYDSDELENMARGIVSAIRKFAIPVEELTDQQIWEELQKKGYRFPVSTKFGDAVYGSISEETDWWFEALHLALEQVRESSGHDPS